MRVNHGTEVRTISDRYPGGELMFRLDHVGETRHELLAPGEQCECGVLGIIREPS